MGIHKKSTLSSGYGKISFHIYGTKCASCCDAYLGSETKKEREDKKELVPRHITLCLRGQRQSPLEKLLFSFLAQQRSTQHAAKKKARPNTNTNTNTNKQSASQKLRRLSPSSPNYYELVNREKSFSFLAPPLLRACAPAVVSPCFCLLLSLLHLASCHETLTE
jgi:hypothetical protein